MQPPKQPAGQKSSNQLPPVKGNPNMGSDDENSDNDALNNSVGDGPNVPVDNIREYILKHYGINAEEEKAKKERRAEKFRQYIQNTGLQVAFQLVISEFLASGKPKEEAFKFAIDRFKKIGAEYEEIVGSVHVEKGSK